MPKEKPIIFSGPMVRAILEGRKSMTRRIVKNINPTLLAHGLGPGHLEMFAKQCRYQPGDLLWVREKHWTVELEGEGVGVPFFIFDDEFKGAFPEPAEKRFAGFDSKFGPHPSIHMPKWAARIWLRVLSVRVERLQEISLEDARAEGTESGLPSVNPIGNFSRLWNSLNAKRGYGWEANPWVWVIEFEKMSREARKILQLEDHEKEAVRNLYATIEEGTRQMKKQGAER